jgi:hypothetical protein
VGSNKHTTELTSFFSSLSKRVRGSNSKAWSQTRTRAIQQFCTKAVSVIGLDTCIHRAPSTIDHRTLQKSGQLPLAFMPTCKTRGCAAGSRRNSSLPMLKVLSPVGRRHRQQFGKGPRVLAGRHGPRFKGPSPGRSWHSPFWYPANAAVEKSSPSGCGRNF